MAQIVTFWIVFGLLAFAFALAVQMRVMIVLVLRRALLAWKPALTPQEAQTAILEAARPGQVSESGEYVRGTFAAQVAQLKLARRVSFFLPPVIAVWLIVGRVGLGAI